VRSTPGALPVFQPVGFPESPPNPACRSSPHRALHKSRRDHALIDPSDFLRAGRLERAWAERPTIFGPEPSIGFGLTEARLSPTAAERNKDDDGGALAAKALRQVWSAARALLVNEELTRMVAGDTDAPITRSSCP
jgi:hypothetical protein